MSSAESPLDRDDAPSASSRDALRGIRAAFATLTRLPVGGFPYTDAEWRWSTAHLPFVGAWIGVLATIAWLAVASAGPTVAALVATGASLLLTGAMHEDGLADTADALGGGGTDRERALRIMKDSRIGTYGASALVLAIGLRVALLSQLGPLAPFAIVLAECASRVVPVVLIAQLPYVTDPSVQKSAAITHAGKSQLAVAMVWVLLLAGPCAWRVVPSIASPVLLAGPLALTAWGAVVFFRKRLGGITGDTLGAAQQITWLALLLAFAVFRGAATPE